MMSGALIIRDKSTHFNLYYSLQIEILRVLIIYDKNTNFNLYYSLQIEAQHSNKLVELRHDLNLGLPIMEP